MPWIGESFRITGLAVSIRVSTTGVAGRFGRGQSTDVLGKIQRFYYCEQADDWVTIFDPVFTSGDISYLRDQVGYIVPSVRGVKGRYRVYIERQMIPPPPWLG